MQPLSVKLPSTGLKPKPGNTKGGSITVPLTSCLTGLDWSVLQIKAKIVCSHTADSEPVKQEVNSIVLPFSIPCLNFKVQFTRAMWTARKRSAICLLLQRWTHFALFTTREERGEIEKSIKTFFPQFLLLGQQSFPGMVRPRGYSLICLYLEEA